MERFRKLSAGIVDALDEELTRRGYGAYARMERAIGQKPKWWYYHRRNGTLRLDELFAILDHLGLDPGEFLLRQLRTDLGLDIGLDSPRGEPPALVARAWERFRADEGDRRFDDSFFTDLNEKAYRDPRAALDLISPLVDLAAPADVCRLLEVAGSAHRSLFELDAADHCYQPALEMAHLLGDEKKLGNLLRRYSYVIAGRGDFARALRIVQVAVTILLREDDDLGLAKACVEIGLWLGYNGQYSSAVKAFTAAIRRLPESEERYRVAAFQSHGIYLAKLGRSRQALESLQSAAPYASDLSRLDRAKLLWLEASLHEQNGSCDRAIRLLDEVVAVFTAEHPGEAAIATCDLVRLQLMEGRLDEAYECALMTRALLEPLASNKIVSAAIAELLRVERSGLEVTLVRRVQRAMETARADRMAWRRLATAS